MHLYGNNARTRPLSGRDERDSRARRTPPPLSLAQTVPATVVRLSDLRCGYGAEISGRRWSFLPLYSRDFALRPSGISAIEKSRPKGKLRKPPKFPVMDWRSFMEGASRNGCMDCPFRSIRAVCPRSCSNKPERMAGVFRKAVAIAAASAMILAIPHCVQSAAFDIYSLSPRQLANLDIRGVPIT